jgi:micrococcal nuclease
MYEYNAELIRIIDGDTVDCWIDLGFDIRIQERVRLAGIDAPETRTRDLEEKAKGFESKEWLIKALDGENTKFIIVTNNFNRTGKYGRTIGTIMLKNGTNINELMVQEGLATVYK